MSSVLIVDDEILVCDALKQLVELAGYQARYALTGADALQIMRDCQPDLVITDLIMPEMDGLELITQLRRAGRVTKIIAISGGATNISKQSQLKVAALMGADLCLEKPFDPQALIGTVNSLLQ